MSRFLISLFVLALLLTFYTAKAQISIGINTGYVSSLSPADPFAPEKDWQNSSNSSELGFYDGATGMATNIFLTWEASNRVSLGLVYRYMQFSNSKNNRSSKDGGLGLRFKVNFISHEKKFVPYGQLQFMFFGNHIINQEQVTDSRGQVQPAFDESVKAKVGVGLDLGLEFKLTGGFYATISGGFHAVDLDEESGRAIEALYIGQVSNNTPDKIIGPMFIQFSGGLKYYFSKRKKKRDF
ncbi:MAG: hypothetical protein HRU69_01860 [Flammeovirgaceae bacterium]|nr:MAG: hypothetical protein HRU69_01860 [Flammeovirgaceae bacterium]